MDHSVEVLRRSGYKVRVKHFRKSGASGLNSRGGKTHVEITTPTGVTLFGYARCSRKENFNKKMGVRIAVGRALKSQIQ